MNLVLFINLYCKNFKINENFKIEKNFQFVLFFSLLSIKILKTILFFVITERCSEFFTSRNDPYIYCLKKIM